MKCMLILLLFVLLPWQLLSAQANTSGMPIIEVDFFMRLEKRLMDAVVAQDRPTLDSLLAHDFELRTSRSGGELTLRNDWLRAITIKHKVHSYRIEGLTLRQIDGASIVNLFCEQQAMFAEKNLSGRFFVVDVWEKTKGGWKLLARYSAGLEVNRHPNSDVKTKE